MPRGVHTSKRKSGFQQRKAKQAKTDAVQSNLDPSSNMSQKPITAKVHQKKLIPSLMQRIIH